MTGVEKGASGIASMLAQYVSEEILGGSTPIGLKDNLLTDGVVDSLGMLRLVGFIEASFDITIAPDQFTIENFRDLEVISAYVDRLIEQGKT